jgi:hypothetical protein
LFSVVSASRLYNGDPRPAEFLRYSIEVAVEGDRKEIARKELGCAKETS